MTTKYTKIFITLSLIVAIGATVWHVMHVMNTKTTLDEVSMVWSESNQSYDSLVKEAKGINVPLMGINDKMDNQAILKKVKQDDEQYDTIVDLLEKLFSFDNADMFYENALYVTGKTDGSDFLKSYYDDIQLSKEVIAVQDSSRELRSYIITKDVNGTYYAIVESAVVGKDQDSKDAVSKLFGLVISTNESGFIINRINGFSPYAGG